VRQSIALLLILAAPALWAQDLNALIQKALNGDKSAQLSLGENYRLGLGVDQNYAEARRFYSLAAAQEVPKRRSR